MYEFDYELENYTLYEKPCEITEMLEYTDSRTDYSEADKKATHEEYDGYEKFSCCWAVHKESQWTGMLILDYLNDHYVIATGIGY